MDPLLRHSITPTERLGREKAMSKSTELLERMTPAEFYAEDPALSEAADRVLGYSLLGEIDRQMKLRSALDELGVAPFTEESVERYKQAVLAEANKQIGKGRALTLLTWIATAVALICLGPALLGWFVSWKVGLASVIGFAVACAVCGVTNGTTVTAEATWNVTPLVGYRTPVPKTVLKTAVALKRRLPQVELTVHELVQRERVLDPFLAARLGETTYFVAVWDEPKFDAESK